LEVFFFADRFGAGLTDSRVAGWKKCVGAVAGASAAAGEETPTSDIRNATRRTVPSRGESAIIISDEKGNNETAVRL
jgi:hypothetical protein